MYVGAIAVPLIVGRALKLTPEQVALLISADLFCCGLVTLIQPTRTSPRVKRTELVFLGFPFKAGCLAVGIDG